MSLLSTLNNASTALQVFSRAIDIEGGNVSNAATPGYVATRTSIQPIGGGGVSASSDFVSVTSAGDVYADARVRAASTDASWSQAKAEILAPLNQLFDVTGSAGLLQAFQRFSAAFADLAVTPNDPILRTTALAAAGDVAVSFRKAASDVDTQRSEIDSAIGRVTTEINRLATQIRDVNVKLRGTEQFDAGQDALRRSAIDELSSLIDISVSFAPDGSATVLTGGQQPLVIGDNAFALVTSPGSPPPRQVTSSGGGNSPGTYGGKLGALLDVRNTTVAALVGDSNKPGTLNTLAQGFASRVNSLVSAGVTSDGHPGQALYLYDGSDGTNIARTIALDPAVTTANLATGTGGTEPHSNGTSNRLARLLNSTDAEDLVGGASLQNLYASVAADVGQELSTARSQASASRVLLATAAGDRQRTSGVSLDDSAIAITSLQRFYQASAKLVSILDTLTNTEINLIR